MGSRLDGITDWEKLAEQANYRVEGMAGFLSVTRGHLRRLFRLRFHGKLGVWLSALRMKKARELLKQGETTKQIAAHLGFKQVSHFSHFFKRHAGVTARAYGRTADIAGLAVIVSKPLEVPVAGSCAVSSAAGTTTVIFTNSTGEDQEPWETPANGVP